MSDQNVSLQSKFVESNPAAPDPTDTLYLDRHITTNSDGSKNYRLVGVDIVLKAGHPNGLWESFHIDRKTESIDANRIREIAHDPTKSDPKKPLIATKTLEIYCDTLRVYGEFSVPEADITIFARQIIWATPDAAINVSPLGLSVPNAKNSDGTSPGEDGVHGRHAGNLSVFVNEVEVVDSPTVEGSVVIYSDPDYQGQSKELKLGNYDMSELKLGIGNDNLSSLRVPKGLKVTLYEHSGFQGRSKSFIADAPKIDDNFDNITSSIKVEPFKRLIANGGNGQDPGEGQDAPAQTIVNMDSQATQQIEYHAAFATTDSIVNFDPPAIYYEYFWFTTDWHGQANDKNYGKKVVSMSDFSNFLGYDDQKILEPMKYWGDNSKTPSPGSNPIAPGKPGKAGNGGRLTTNHADLSESLLNRAGQAGVKAKDCTGIRPGNPAKYAKYQVHVLAPPTWFANRHNRPNRVLMIGKPVDNTANGKDAIALEADTKVGNSPAATVMNEPDAWLHPLNLQKAIEYARDLLLSNHREDAEQFLVPYHQVLYSEIPMQTGAWNDANKAQWISGQSEISTMRLNLSSHLDYFGNPGGFAPFLSLSSTIQLYQNESQRVLKVLLLSRWLSEKAQANEEKTQALQESIVFFNQDTQEAATQIVATEQKISSAIDGINALSQQLQDKANELEALRTELLAEAEHDVTQQHQIRFAVKLCAAICQVIPVAQPVLGSVATLASVLYDLGVNENAPIDESSDDEKPDTSSTLKEAFENCYKAYEEYSEVNKKAKEHKSDGNESDEGDHAASESSAEHTSDKDKDVEKAEAEKSGWAKVGEGVGPAIALASDALSALKVPQAEVDAELNRLIAQSPRWADIVQQIQTLNSQKSKLVAELEQSLHVLGRNYARITANCSATVKLHQQVAERSLLLDFAAVHFVDQMAQSAKSRLLYALYLMIKAYETTFFQSYEDSSWWKLDTVFNKAADFAKAASKYDESSMDQEIASQARDSLGVIFNDPIDKIRKKLLDFYSSNNPGNTEFHSQEVVFSNTQNSEVLSRLSEEGKVVLDPARYGLFNPDKEMSRIEKISVTDIQFLELKLMVLERVEDLPQAQSNVMVLAKVNERYYIRIFDDNGSIVFTAHEPDFQFEPALEQQLNLSLQNLSAVTENQKREYIQKIKSTIGYRELDDNENISIIVRPAQSGMIRSNQDFYSIYSKSPLVWTADYSSSTEGKSLALTGDLYSSVGALSANAGKQRIDDNLNFLLNDSSNSIKEKIARPPLLSDLSIEVTYNLSGSRSSKHRITRLALKFDLISAVAPSNQKVLQIQSVEPSNRATIEIHCDPDSTTRYAYQQTIRVYPYGTTVNLSIPSEMNTPSQLNEAHFEKWVIVQQQASRSQTIYSSTTSVSLTEHTIVKCYWSTSPVAAAFVALEAEPADDYPDTENLPIYQAALRTSTILDILPDPNQAEILQVGEAGWQQVNYKGIVGWIQR